MKIYTLTLNPAYDIHAGTSGFAAYHENLATVNHSHAGGKGVNISRALHSAGIPNTAVVVLGRENAVDYTKQLSHLDCLYLEREGRIRENLTLHEDGKPETRISFTGFSLDESILDEVQRYLVVEEDTIITFTGRVPTGICVEAVRVFLKDLQRKGAKIVLDSKSFAMEDIYDLKPWLIKPNQEEISQYFACAVEDLSQAAKLGGAIASKGITNVMISLGEQGAILATAEGVYTAVPPAIEAVSTIGAGDSAVAGFIAAAAAGKSSADCLKTAVAFGTAACLTEGTLPPNMETVTQIFRKIT